VARPSFDHQHRRLHGTGADPERDGKVVQLFTRRGHDWTERYPGIAATAAKLRAKTFTMDGEAAVSDGSAACVRTVFARSACAAGNATAK